MKKQLEAEVQITEEAVMTVLQSSISKSKKMIALFDLGLDTKEISEVMTRFEGKLVRYNFVYNVLSNHININGIPVESQERSGKKEQILAMFLAGKTNKEISIDLKTNYNYVFNTIKTFKKEHPDYVIQTTDEVKAIVEASQAAQ